MKKQTHEMNKFCVFCENAEPLQDKSTMLCRKKGVVSSDYVCRKFKYDPLKREPHAMVDMPSLTPDDLI